MQLQPVRLTTTLLPHPFGPITHVKLLNGPMDTGSLKHLKPAGTRHGLCCCSLDMRGVILITLSCHKGHVTKECACCSAARNFLKAGKLELSMGVRKDHLLSGTTSRAQYSPLDRLISLLTVGLEWSCACAAGAVCQKMYTP